MTDLIATLIAPRGSGSKLANALKALSDLLDVSTVDELAQDEAVDLRFRSSEALPALRLRLRRLIADMPLDIVVQPTDSRRKRLLIADMDSTIIGQEAPRQRAPVGGPDVGRPRRLA